MQRTKQDISALIERGETFHLECKKAQGGLPGSLWESYSAFCNTDGGVILLGVKEIADSFSVEGVTDAAAIVKAFWDTVHNREKVSACVLTEKDVRVEDCDGKSVVVINVPRAERRARPVYIGNNVFEGTYRRNGEGDYKCTRDSVESMIRDHCEETADACLMDELTAEDLNADTIRRYRGRFANFKPTSQWNELSDHDFQIHDKIVSDVQKPFAIAKDGISRIDENDVHESIREVLANALIHADYHGRRGIVIEKHFRHITFENPGCFRVNRVDAVAGGRSDARNQYIFNIFALVKIGERSGHGLSNLFGVWKKSGYPEPVISESYDPDRTTIELKFEGPPKAGPVLSQNGAEGSVESRQELDNNQTINRQEKLSDLSASVRRVFVELEHNPSFTQAGLVSKLGLSCATITTAIATLIKRGLLRRVGPRKGGHWEIVKPQPPTGGIGSYGNANGDIQV